MRGPAWTTWPWPSRAPASVHCDDQNTPVRMMGSHLDIPEARRSEEDLRFPSIALDQLSVGVCWMDESGRFVHFDQAACANLGYTRGELQALDISAIDPGFPPPAWAGLWARMARESAAVLESVHRRKDGTTFPVEVHARFVEIQGMQLLCGLAADITARKRAQEALRAARDPTQRGY